LQQHQQELNERGVDVLAVTFESEEVAGEYAADLPWPMLLDPERKLYAEYGLERGSFWQIWGPASWWGFIKLLFSGHQLRWPTADVYQLGGDVLIDPQGTVRLHHVSRNPMDRPTMGTLLMTMDRLPVSGN
jgi:alkyl hydroperoxide reductase subunit AhpC